MIYTPDPHQVEAKAHLVANPRAALFLGMSLSKTAIALDYLNEMHYEEAAITKTLVIAPDKVARLTWPDEIKKWDNFSHMRYSLIAGDAKKRVKALEADAEIYIIGIDNLSWLIDLYIKQRVSKNTGLPYGPWFGSLPFDSVVIDELSIFKGRDSIRFLKLRRALDLSEIEYRIGMTGTPTPNGLIDLWAEMVLIDSGARLGETFGQYLDAYFTCRGDGMIVYEYIPRPGAPSSIAKKIQDIALTMQTRDHLKLPALHTVDEEIHLDPFDKDIYDQLEREYVIDFLEGGETTVKTPADLTNKLLQISSGAIYEDRADPKAPRVWHELNDAKLNALGGLLDMYPSETFIVVYQFRHEIERIKARFPFAREFRKGKGSIEDFREWNEGKIRLLLLHPASAGHGLNLQFGGRRMVWFTQTWNLEYYLQTIARILRRGALREIFIHRLIVAGTRDSIVKRRIASKDTNQNFLLNEIKSLRAKYGKLR